MVKEFKPGKLVAFRGRDWMVLPSADPELLLLKPLGGSEEEITGVFRPLNAPGEAVSETELPRPKAADLHDFSSAKLLFEANRLSFRNASGPFRCMGKLSFRPRSYQIVPLVMALKQRVVRLLLADDVGIGKTVEALLILKELIERGEITRFAVICPPHLCEQWQQELKEKLDMDAEIIRSSTAATLDRKIPDDNSIFFHVPYQVISIDYIKADRRRPIFLKDCPELIIIDEAHTCALPAGSKSRNQQQRYHLLHEIAQDPHRHLLLLTATPHSGKDEEFKSLLGLVNPELEAYDLSNLSQKERRRIARHFLQRKRENIRRWLKEVTPFPERESKEIAYQLSPEYAAVYQQIWRFAKGFSKESGNQLRTRVRYWAALALLRGVMSSPAAGLSMLLNRHRKRVDELLSESDLPKVNPAIDSFSTPDDDTLQTWIDDALPDVAELREMERLARQLEALSGPEKDWKARKAISIVKQWIGEDFHPIIFCRFISTANYLGALLKAALPASVEVQVVTSEMADEQRREMVAALGNFERRVMIATDCLSEGINLQEHFTAVLHYDLPWNPNRIEQREGRVDRYGQTAPIVKAALLWGENNRIDNIVLQVLIKKVRDIQRATGVSITIGDESSSIMDSVLKEVLSHEDAIIQPRAIQLSLDFGVDFSLQQTDQLITNELEQAKEKALRLRSIFAHETVKPEDIEPELREVDEAIGDIRSVEQLVIAGLAHLGVLIHRNGPGFILHTTNLPPHLKRFFPGQTSALICFDSPTPRGYRYIGRNHRFVEQLCQFLLGLAFEQQGRYQKVARAAVVQTDAVSIKTTLVQFRVRNVIKEVGSYRELVSEEMYLWGYRGSGTSAETLDYAEAKTYLLHAQSVGNFPAERQKAEFESALTTFADKQSEFHTLAEARAEHLVEAHGRFKNLVGGRRYEAVHPVLPPDIMGVYLLIPKPKQLF